MIFNKHSGFAGQHAFLGASKWHWINYTEDKLIEVYNVSKAQEMGTKLHDYARFSIELGQKLPDLPKTLNMYVNDAIGFGMTPEQILFYSEFCFGTADTISFRDNTLRIHDLKTGLNPAHIEQLRIYAAIFCLEYGYEPKDIKIVLRIYQNNDIIEEYSDPEEIKTIMIRIKVNDKILKNIKYKE